MLDLSQLFLTIPDPRMDRTKKHTLGNILALAVYAIIVGANTWIDIEYICDEKKDELDKFLNLENGIPSHDTFQRVFAKLNPKELNNVLTIWAQELLGSLDKKHIAIDGKAVRKSFDHANEKSAIHTLNAFVVDSLTILRQEVGSKKDSEIKMIPILLEGIDIKNAIISIDAIGCQKEIIKQIRKKKADYLIALKGNQSNLHKEVGEYFAFAEKGTIDSNTFSLHQSTDKGHGRIESRSCFCLNTNYFPLDYAQGFTDIKTIVRLTSMRDIKGKQTVESRYYISSLECEAEKIATTIRGHWAIENSLHYVLDVIYHEDDNRTRKDHAPANFSLLRKTAISLINLHKDKKLTQKRARLKALLHPNYAAWLFFGKHFEEI